MKRVWLSFAALVVLVLASSWFVSSLWGGKAESAPIPSVLTFTPGETVGAFLERNHVPSPVAEAAFGQGLDRSMPLAGLPFAPDEVRARLQKASVLAGEGAGKNWRKIAPKLGLWATVIFVMALLVRRGWLDRRTRKGYYLGAVVLFGVAFGSDPSPMGTVKDAIVLLAKDGVVFPPRLIALAGFLLTVILANKAICAWGCQFGVLQDLVFRLNRNRADSQGIMRQHKVPFAVSNTIRISLFAVFTLAAFLMGLDLIEFGSFHDLQSRASRSHRRRFRDPAARGLPLRLPSLVPLRVPIRPGRLAAGTYRFTPFDRAGAWEGIRKSDIYE